MMATHLRGEIFPLVLAFMLGGQFAQADIYTWVDASGATNVSNLSPPEGVRVTHVTHENPQPTARLDTARDAAHDAEIQSLSERVRELQHEVELARPTRRRPSRWHIPRCSLLRHRRMRSMLCQRRRIPVIRRSPVAALGGANRSIRPALLWCAHRHFVALIPFIERTTLLRNGRCILPTACAGAS
jgi:hypothetical protein